MMMIHELKEKEEELAELKMASSRVSIPHISCSAWKSSSSLDERSVVVHFVRHGQAAHNVFATNWRSEGRAGNCYVDSSCPMDPFLTDTGRLDAKRAGSSLKSILGNRSVAFASSPMRRTLETCFVAQQEMGVAHPGCVVLDDARERFGLHICDNLIDFDRSATFPFADWSKSSKTKTFGRFCFFLFFVKFFRTC